MLSDYVAQFKADKHQPLYILITIKHRVKLLPTTLRIYIYIKTMLIKSKPKRITERKKLREREHPHMRFHLNDQTTKSSVQSFERIRKRTWLYMDCISAMDLWQDLTHTKTILDSVQALTSVSSVERPVSLCFI